MEEQIQAIDLRRGQTIIWKGDIYLVLEHSFNKTAMRVGIVKCKVKSLKTKSITVEDFSGQKFERAIIEKVDVIFSYLDNGIAHFLDKNTYVDISVDANEFKNELKYLEEGMEISLSVWKDEVLYINLPELVSVEISGFENDTTQSDQRKAITSSGLSVMVPKFCNVGDKILVSTSDGKYRSR